MGEPKGVKLQGGLLEVITREVEIECLPDEIPESYTVDVTELMIGQNLRASDIPLSGSVKLVSAPEQVVAHVVTLKAEEVVRRRRRVAADGRRAGSDQEGQEGRGEAAAGRRGSRSRRAE